MKPHIKKDKNYIEDLVNYIKRNLQKGYTIDSLRWALLNQGHARIEVEKALNQAQKDSSKTSQVPKQQPSQIQPSVQIKVEPESQKSWFKRFFG